MMNIIAIFLVCTTFMRDTYFDLVARIPTYNLPYIHTIGSGPTVPRVAITQPPPSVHFVTYTSASALPSIITKNYSTFESTYPDAHRVYPNFGEPHTKNFTPPEAVTFEETKWGETSDLVLAVFLGLFTLHLVYKYRLHLSAILSITLRPAHPHVTNNLYELGIVHAGSESHLIDHTRVLVHDLGGVTCIQAASAESIENEALRSNLRDLHRTLINIRASKEQEIDQLKSEKEELQSELSTERMMLHFREFSRLFEPREAQTNQQPDDQCSESMQDGEPAEQDQPQAVRPSLQKMLLTKQRDQTVFELLQEEVRQLLEHIDRLKDEKSQQHKNISRLRYRRKKGVVLSTKPEILVKVSSARKREIRRANLAHQRQIDVLAAENRKLKSSVQSKVDSISKLKKMLPRKRKTPVYETADTTPDASPKPATCVLCKGPMFCTNSHCKEFLMKTCQGIDDGFLAAEKILSNGMIDFVTDLQDASWGQTDVLDAIASGQMGIDQPISQDVLQHTQRGGSSPNSQAEQADQSDAAASTREDYHTVGPGLHPALDDSRFTNAEATNAEPNSAAGESTQMAPTSGSPSTDDWRQSSEPVDTVSGNASSQGAGTDQNDLQDASTALGPSNAASRLQQTPQFGFQFGGANAGSQGEFSFGSTASYTPSFPDPEQSSSMAPSERQSGSLFGRRTCKTCSGPVEGTAEYCKKCAPAPSDPPRLRRDCQNCAINTALPPQTLCRPCRSRKNGRGSGVGPAGRVGDPSSTWNPNTQSGTANASSQATNQSALKPSISWTAGTEDNATNSRAGNSGDGAISTASDFSDKVFGPTTCTTSFFSRTGQSPTAPQDSTSASSPAKTPANIPGAMSTSQSQSDDNGAEWCGQCKQRKANISKSLCDDCHAEMYE